MVDIDRLIGFMAIMQVPFMNDPDALAYIEEVKKVLKQAKAQQPRAMTLEEVRLLGKDDVVWYENKGVFVQPRPRVVEFVFDEHITFTDGGILSLSSDDYRKRWILWTSRPTDAQREAESRYGEQD